MKKVLVYDCAAESGGALTVLKQFYEKYAHEHKYKYYFVVSVAELEGMDHLKVIKLPWVKKSWFHRLYCDFIYMPRLINKCRPDHILSLQNIAIPRVRQKQAIYVHNAIPFTEQKFKPWEEPMLFIYQNVIGRMMYASIKKAGAVIVQTEWMKWKIADACKIDARKIAVDKIRPVAPKNVRRIETDLCSFFYPAHAVSYKNHGLIIDACKRLKADGIEKYKVYLTIAKDENALSKKLYASIKSENLPIELLGQLNREEMEKMYRSCILVFPSCLETVGLPLLEAQAFHSTIFAADCLYAKDAVGDYEKKAFFDLNNEITLYTLMKKAIVRFSKNKDGKSGFRYTHGQ